MNRWTYYSPFLFGVAGSLALWDPSGAAARFGDQARLLIVPVALAWGLFLQVGFIGIQGAFAQVLPVPGGRSMRGAIPVVVGWLILAAVALLLVVAILDPLELRAVRQIIMGGAVATGLAAAIAYAWGWPTAERDFADRD